MNISKLVRAAAPRRHSFSDLKASGRSLYTSP
jgi:hypothetical protein